MDVKFVEIWTINLDRSNRLNSYRATLSVTHKIHDQNPYPRNDRQPSGNYSKDEGNGGVNAVVSATFEAQVFVKIVHKVEYRAAAQTRLQYPNHLSGGMNILDDTISILLASREKSVSQNNCMHQCVDRHNKCNNCRWAPKVWRNIVSTGDFLVNC